MVVYLMIMAFVAVIVFVYAAALRIAVISILRRLGRADRDKLNFLDKKKIKYAVIALAVIFTLCIAEGYFIEPFWIEVTEHQVSLDKIPDGGKIRIVHLSDLHIEEETEREESLPDIVNALEPDIIVITGDYLNEYSGSPALSRFLSRLKAPCGIYAVYGNFRVFYDPSETLRKSNISILDDDEPGADNKYRIDVDVRGIPVSIFGFEGYDDRKMRAAAAGLDDSRVNVVLFHKPDYIEDVEDIGFDIYLCGHTHGGQVRMPLYGALITLARHGKKYEMGEYKVGKTFMYVNRGVGMEGWNAPRVRFLCRPEVAVIDVTK